MNREIMENNTLQELLASLGTEDEQDQPLGKYGRMAMDYLNETNPQRFMLLKMTGKLMSMMHDIDEQATNMMLKIEGDYIKQHPLPNGDDFMAVVRARNTARVIAEEFVLHDLIYC